MNKLDKAYTDILQDILDNGCNIWNGDAYKNYLKKSTENYENHNTNVIDADIPSHWKNSVKLDLSELLSQEEFIKKIKTDDEFAKKWGVTIETREYAVYERIPAHGSKVNGIILAPYKSKEDAQQAREKYGYNTDNYYIDILKYE